MNGRRTGSTTITEHDIASRPHFGAGSAGPSCWQVEASALNARALVAPPANVGLPTAKNGRGAGVREAPAVRNSRKARADGTCVIAMRRINQAALC